jgi:hypothetical protein
LNIFRPSDTLNESTESWWLIWFFANHPNVFVNSIYVLIIRTMAVFLILYIHFSKIMSIIIEIYFLFWVFN